MKELAEKPNFDLVLDGTAITPPRAGRFTRVVQSVDSKMPSETLRRSFQITLKMCLLIPFNQKVWMETKRHDLNSKIDYPKLVHSTKIFHPAPSKSVA